MWEVDLFITKDGKCPSREFLDGLSPSLDLPFVMNDLKRLEEFGHLLHRPQVEYLKRGIYELRTHTPSGQIRLLYFFFNQEKIIISHGIRKEKKVPIGEIDRAVANKEDYFKRHERKSSVQEKQMKGKGNSRRKLK